VATSGVVVGSAGRKGKGVFASRRFESGELIARFVGRRVVRAELAQLSQWEHDHLGEVDVDVWQVLPEPVCYLNHACEPNAIHSSSEVRARRAIAPGEEITIDYRLNAYDDGDVWKMTCECGATSGPHDVIGDFFSLPPARQRSYLPVAPPFIRAMYERRARGSAPEDR
jgi:SET domain-containing protein